MDDIYKNKTNKRTINYYIYICDVGGNPYPQYLEDH